MEEHACCAPVSTRHKQESSATPVSQADTLSGSHGVEQISIPAGAFLMGDALGDGRPSDGEAFVHEVSLEAFQVDATTVTNADFARFVAATGYKTEAEQFSASAVFHLALKAEDVDVVGQPLTTPWWLGVRGADWQHPEGRLSDLTGRDDHPVVHVSWNDANAYCQWTGRRLPTEAEWEYASRGGISQVRYPWGNELLPDGQWRCNIWQGTFPRANTFEDGFLTTAPVQTYEPNGFGLWQTVGNVWEWCSDWFSPRYYETSPSESPHGPPTGQNKVMRGGSFLCHDSYCNRYRNSARSSNTPDSSMANAGFRTVAL